MVCTSHAIVDLSTVTQLIVCGDCEFSQFQLKDVL